MLGLRADAGTELCASFRTVPRFGRSLAFAADVLNTATQNLALCYWYVFVSPSFGDYPAARLIFQLPIRENTSYKHIVVAAEP